MGIRTRSRAKYGKRRSAIEARREALDVARDLLLKHGPSGVTLHNIAARLKRSHATLIHHFGCAEELQAALMSRMVEDLAQALVDAMTALEPGEDRSRAVVDIVFDAFNRDGAALLAAWIVLSNKGRDIETVRDAVQALAMRVDEKLKASEPERAPQLPAILLFLTFCAFGDALMGDTLSPILGRERNAMRCLARQFLPHFSDWLSAAGV